MGCEISWLIKKLIKAGTSRKVGAFRKTMQEYTPKVLQGQRKSPTSLEDGPKIKTNGQDNSGSGN